MHCSSRSHIACDSSSVAALVRSGTQAERSVVWPISGATLTAGRASATACAYAVTESYWNELPSSVSAPCGCSTTNGATDKPQLPVTTVVTPCDSLGNMPGAPSTTA